MNISPGSVEQVCLFGEAVWYIVPITLLGIFLITIYGLKEAKSCELKSKHTHLRLCGIAACCCHVIIFKQDKICPGLSDFSCEMFPNA